MSRADQLRQLSAQLASLASLEDTVAWGTHTLLEAAPERTVPVPVQSPQPRSRTRSRSRSRTLLPKRALARRGSVLLSEDSSPTGLAVQRCPLAPPGRTRLSRVPSVAAATSEVCSRSFLAHARRPACLSGPT